MEIKTREIWGFLFGKYFFMASKSTQIQTFLESIARTIGPIFMIRHTFKIESEFLEYLSDLDHKTLSVLLEARDKVKILVNF